MECLYETLGVNKGANADEIKKAFRSLSLLHHPDKGGGGEKFKEINRAYQLLSNEHGRKNTTKGGRIKYCKHSLKI